MTLRMAALAVFCVVATSAVAQPVPGTEIDSEQKVYSGSVPIGTPIYEIKYTTRFLGKDGDVVLTELCTERVRQMQPSCNLVTGQAVLHGVIPVANLKWRTTDGDRAALADALRDAEWTEGLTLPEVDFLPLTDGKTVTWSQAGSTGNVLYSLTQTCCSTTPSPFDADHEVWILRMEMSREETGKILGRAIMRYDAEIGWVFAQQSSGLEGSRTTSVVLPTELRQPE
ncbi:hypothetical protein KUV73_00210 [Mameliella alba]|nr:hypothetical protein [Mameliella alba]MBY6167736.1 hypothetical protein [Mameliella alba]MBY6172757.1 hypothetical protein [Mameliella alba]